jgi:nitroreductase
MTTDFSQRDPIPGLDELFSNRWSPRAFDGSEISHDTLATLIDAARWSPSCYNEQPWRFYTSNAGNFDEYLNLLVEGNQAWAKTASVIGFLVGKTQFSSNDKDNTTHQFDCGAAWMAMSLQARKAGLFTHGMAGIKYDEIANYLQLAEGEAVMMAFAIGREGDTAQLPEAFQAKEVPSPRKSLDEIWPER